MRYSLHWWGKTETRKPHITSRSSMMQVYGRFNKTLQGITLWLWWNCTFGTKHCCVCVLFQFWIVYKGCNWLNVIRAHDCVSGAVSMWSLSHTAACDHTEINPCICTVPGVGDDTVRTASSQCHRGTKHCLRGQGCEVSFWHCCLPEL